MARKKNVNGVLMDLTPEEEVYRDEREARAVTEKAEVIEVLEQKSALKSSAKAKLIAGEALTEAEADTIVL